MMDPLWTPPAKCPSSQAPGVGASTGLEANSVKGPMAHWLSANISMESGRSLGKSPHQRSMLKEYSSQVLCLSALGNCHANVPSARCGLELDGACTACSVRANGLEASIATDAVAACKKFLLLVNDGVSLVVSFGEPLTSFMFNSFFAGRIS